MHIDSNNFIPLSHIALNKTDERQAISTATAGLASRRNDAMFAQGREHGEALRQQAYEIKRRALRKLPELLEQAEANMQANGMTVLWATDTSEAHQHILDIAREHQVKLISKSKSMVTEEIGLNPVLEANQLEVVETDLGEYIIQLNHEMPSHIIAPVIHKNKDSIRKIFMDELGMPYIEEAEDMTQYVRKHLRDVFLKADMGISGGNFIIAETGSLGLVMNEGNGRMVTVMPRVHVALVGIEKIVETVEDYATLVQVLARSATGQNMSVYSHIVNGPRPNPDVQGADHVYVIFLDNGRSNIYHSDYTESLACIRCSACLNACPVYSNLGGHAYGWVYSGPIGAVITPLLGGIENATPLPHASSLCGKCKEVCPVNIDIPRMLLDLRRDLVAEGHTELQWDIAMRGWAFVNKSPRLFEMGGKAARLGLATQADNLIPSPLGKWKKYRDFPSFAPKSFRQLWRERQQKRDQ